ncbi:MAG: hypothetical protein KDD06_20450 [Phaeodactylibacter sp.]|nr:hypothetical protein [Phaeodactylibacter sp.]MCB9285852.1 GHMP kinase [Lewinellaceae bacterium]
MLDGALALALPVRFGQQLTVTEQPHLSGHHWVSFGQQGRPWFEGRFSSTGVYASGNDEETGNRLEQLFQAIAKQRPDFWLGRPPLRFETHLEFPRQWGLGSSSTLVAALAEWAEVDAFQLLADTFGGSGYDIACAYARQPILFQRRNGKAQYVECPFTPSFSDNVCFVYLGKKQDSREGIARYRKVAENASRLLDPISRLTMDFLRARTVKEGIAVLEAHEELVGDTLQLPRVKERYFSNFPGAVKSLGAWGGDFVMALSEKSAESTRQYFRVKGFEVVFSWKEMVLAP